MSDQAIRKIVIVGGGTAGWMAAAGLSKVLGSKACAIELVESDAIGTVGVGEATIPSLVLFHQMLGIDEDEFVRATQATFKLGIAFEDWSSVGETFYHPFGSYGFRMDPALFHAAWIKLRALGQAGPLDDYSINTSAARAGRFTRAGPGSPPIHSTISYAYHFDAGLYARFLRGLAERTGVVRTEGRIVRAIRREADGLIAAVELADGRKVEGDFFIDCSGFRGLLIEETLKTGYEDWSHWLPCDRAVAAPCANVGSLAPFTRSTALEAGWKWKLPLQHRTGNGYVYSSQFLNDDAATARLIGALDAPPLADPRLLRFTAGRRKQVWNGNVLALGLAGGFLEPLESTSIHMIQTGLGRLFALLPDKRFSPALIAEYNRLSREESETIRDFIIAHYALTARKDTPLWRHCREMALPDDLSWKIQQFRANGRLLTAEGETFLPQSWLALFAGQGITPRAYDIAADTRGADAARQFRAAGEMITQAVAAMPTHADFIAARCAAPPPMTGA
jgi:tryptophan halogenase